MKGGQFVLGLDIDNCLNNCAECFLELLRAQFGVTIDLGVKNDYAFTEHATIEQEAWVLNHSHDLLFSSFSPKRSALMFLQHLHCVLNAKRQRVRFVYVTDRRFKGFPRQDLLNLPPIETTYEHTLQWLQKYGFPVSKLYLEGDKGRSKGQIAIDEGVDIFVEDAVRKAKDIAAHFTFKEGLDRVFLMLMPWNRHDFIMDSRKEQVPLNIRYVKDWAEIALLLRRRLASMELIDAAETEALLFNRKQSF